MRNRSLSKCELERLKKFYPEGTRVKLVCMDDPYTKLTPGTQGTVKVIDDMGTIFVAWDNGSCLGVVYGVDRIKKI